MKILKTIILIVVCLYVGAFVGKENIKIGTEMAIEKTKAGCIWVKKTWDKDYEDTNL